MASELKVSLQQHIDRSYTIAVKPGIFSRLPAVLARAYDGRRLFIITDSRVLSLWGRALHHGLHDAGANAVLLSFDEGEKSKNARTVASLHTQLLSHGITRDSVIIVLGGGVVGDVAGFVASTILRGVQYVQIPTTLLSQVDSSVGGKVGIDHPAGKNLIGAFHQPCGVYIDPVVLKTLPVREFRAGLAEVVKIAAALDAGFFRYLERNRQSIRKDNPQLLASLIRKSVGLKAAVVEQDEHEANFRKVLNLGHTIGHAIEAATNYSILHGEAVAIGIAVESELAVRLGILPARDYRMVIDLLKSLKLPVSLPGMNKRRFFDALSLDKKSVNGRTQFVLLKSIGSSVIGVEVSQLQLSKLVT